ncbi:MAG: hypothetical protein ACKO6N_11615 [Myxococcota bacterium]
MRSYLSPLYLLLLASSLLVCDTAAMAAEAGEPLTVLNLLPSSLSATEVERLVREKIEQPVKLVSTDELLLEHLRWVRPDPDRQNCEAQFSVMAGLIKNNPPARPEELFKALLNQAGQQIDNLDLAGAQVSLRNARASVPCLESVLAPSDVRQLFLLTAVTNVYLKNNQHTDPFINMLAADSNPYLEDSYPPKVRTPFLAVFQQFSKLQPVKLEKDVPTETGLLDRFFLDGKKVSGLDTVPPARYVVQLQGPSGELRSALIVIKPGQSVKLSSLVQMGILAPDVAVSELIKGLNEPTLNANLSNRLNQYALATGRKLLLMAIPQADSTAVQVRAFVPGQGLVPLEDVLKQLEAQETSDKRNEDTPPRPAVQKLVGLGFSVRAHAGVGRAFVTSSPSVQELLAELSLRRYVGTQLHLSAFGQLRYTDEPAGLAYPSLVGGGVVGLDIPVARAFILTPTLGYAVGKGAPVSLACQHPTESGAPLTCTLGEGDDAESTATLYAASRGNGPLMAVDLQFERRFRKTSLGIHVGLQGQVNLFGTLSEGTASGLNQSFQYELEDGQPALLGARVDLHGGLDFRF